MEPDVTAVGSVDPGSVAACSGAEYATAAEGNEIVLAVDAAVAPLSAEVAAVVSSDAGSRGFSRPKDIQNGHVELSGTPVGFGTPNSSSRVGLHGTTFRMRGATA